MVFREDRTRRDEAGIGPDPNYVTGDLVPMRELPEFRFPAGEPDIRGWEVCTLTGQQIGSVDDVLVDTRRGQVVMLDVDIREAGHRDVPIRAVQIDRARNRVVVDRADMGEPEAGTDRSYIGDASRFEPRDSLDRDVGSRGLRDELRRHHLNQEPSDLNDDSEGVR